MVVARLVACLAGLKCRFGLKDALPQIRAFREVCNVAVRATKKRQPLDLVVRFELEAQRLTFVGWIKG
jgi:hypothetical protein